jgi:hypothetical protein
LFTRHLEDKPSAYGFVLYVTPDGGKSSASIDTLTSFNCVEDAERFIMTLRQHTQFHPSFAKVSSLSLQLLIPFERTQTVKVPGTTNAKHAISDPVIPLPRDEDYADISITGLPLTIDMQVSIALDAHSSS